MATQKDLEFSLKFLMNPIVKTKSFRNQIDLFIRSLELEFPEQLANIKEFQEALLYPGSEVAQEVAIALGKAINTEQGRRTLGLSAKKRGDKYRCESLETRDKLLFAMILNKAGEGSNLNVQHALDDAIGENVSESTRAKFLAKLDDAAEKGVILRRHFFEAHAKNENLFKNFPLDLLTNKNKN